MLQAGKCIYQNNDLLVKVNVDYLYYAIKNPNSEIKSAIRQIRLVKNIDIKRYQLLKRNLPYFVTSIFHPPARKTENFAWTNHFIMDIDHLSSKNTTPDEVKSKLISDSRILMMFVSPGDDGLKILFRLKEKIYDSGRYSLFYRLFLKKFSEQYQLEQVVDPRTSDVTRACFISYDNDLFYNPDADMIITEDHIDFNNYLEIRQLKSELRSEDKTAQQKPKLELEDSVLEKIKQTLNPNFKVKHKKQIYIPDEIEQVTASVITRMEEQGIATTEVTGIHYGKKFKFILANKKAEINLFYGKRGFSIVISPRIGTDGELNSVCKQLMSQWLL